MIETYIWIGVGILAVAGFIWVGYRLLCAALQPADDEYGKANGYRWETEQKK